MSRNASKRSKKSETLTVKEAEYLKTVFILASGGERIGSLEVAGSLGVSCATASEYLKKLWGKGMLKREPWKGVSLSENGLEEVNRIIRNHRIFETYAYRFLSISLKDACECASKVELHLPEKIVDSMCSVLGHPKACPHEKPISEGRSCCSTR